MVIIGAEGLKDDAHSFWTSELGSLSDELKEWLAESVRDVQLLWGDIGRMSRGRTMWKALVEAIEAVDGTNQWMKSYCDMYVDSQLIAITRLMWSDKDGVSLGCLLKGFERHKELCGDLKGNRVRDDRRAAIDPVKDRGDLGRLTTPFRHWRNKRVAHFERGAVLEGISWEQLDEAIVEVIDLFDRYAYRLTGVNYQVSIDDEPNWFGWKDIFKQPLFGPDNKPIGSV